MANIETTAELNKLLREQNKIFAVQAKIMRGQMATAKAMAEALGQVTPERLSKSFEEMNAAIKGADEAMKEFTTSGQSNLANMGEAAEKNTGLFGKFTKGLDGLGKKATLIGFLGSTLEGLATSGKLVWSAFSTLFDITKTLIGTFASFAVSIITGPFKMLNALMEYAASFNGTEFMQAIQDTKKIFGDLHKNEGAAVIKSFRNIQGELANTGLSSRRVLGNMAERLNFVRETAEALGRQFGNLKEDIMANVEATAAYVKGLGLSNEGIAAVGKQATASGKSFTEVGREITTMAYGMGDAFGINGKLISRDISEMAGDFENFSSVGIKTMSQVAVFTRKLGIEIKDLLGLVGKFDDFESAAESAAQLSQAFGMQVDALEMMKEQDPAARFENLRKAFARTGKSVENLSRQETNLLAQQTGLSAEALKLGFANGNMGMSYDDVQKKAAATEKKQLSQAEAMEKLAKSIERLVKQGQEMKGGFFDIFMQGFSTGVKWTKEFWGLTRNLNQAMRITMWEGRMLGQTFVKIFPGIKDVFGGLKDMFEPNRWRKMMQGVRKIFTDFFRDLRDGKNFSIKSMLLAFKQNFFNWFDSRSAAGAKMLNGFKTFFNYMMKVARVAIKEGMEALTDSIRFIVDLIKNPQKAINAVSGPSNEFMQFVIDTFKPIYKMVEKDLWPPLKKALKDLWKIVWAEIKNLAAEGFSALWEGFKALPWKAQLLILAPTLIQAFAPLLAVVGGHLATKGAEKIGKTFWESLKGFIGSKEQIKEVKDRWGDLEGLGTQVKASSGAMNFGQMAKTVGAGILALAGIIVVMGAAFLTMKWALKKTNTTQAEVDLVMSTVKVMGAMFLGAGVILAESLGIGAAAAVPIFGQGALALATIGFGILSGIIALMFTEGTSIINNINALNIPPDFERKADVFLKVFGGIAKVAKSMAGLLTKAKPTWSLLGMFKGDEGAMGQNLAQINTIIGTIGLQVQDIISTIGTTLGNMSPESLSQATVLGPMLEAVGGIMQALIPPPGLLDKDWGKKVLPSEVLGAVSNYMLSVKDIIIQMIPDIAGMMQVISAYAIQPELVTSFVGFMDGIGNLMKALTPSDTLLEILKSLPRDVRGMGARIAELIGPMQAYMGGMIRGMVGKGGILASIGRFMKGALKATEGITDVKRIDATANLLSVSLESITKIIEMFSPEKIGMFQMAASQDLSTDFERFTQNVLQPMNSWVATAQPDLLTLAQQIKVLDKAFSTGVGTGLTDLVSKVNGVTEKLSSIDWSKKNLRVQLKQTADKLGLKGTKQLRVNMNDLKIVINVGVTLDADKFEEALRTRPKGSQFAIK